MDALLAAKFDTAIRRPLTVNSVFLAIVANYLP
jgi:hypothetical protein